MKKTFVASLSLFFTLFFLVSGVHARANLGGPSGVPSLVGHVPDEIVVKFNRSVLSRMNKVTALEGRLGIPSLDRLGPGVRWICS
jgi:hypothetical protein